MGLAACLKSLAASQNAIKETTGRAIIRLASRGTLLRTTQFRVRFLLDYGAAACCTKTRFSLWPPTPEAGGLWPTFFFGEEVKVPPERA